MTRDKLHTAFKTEMDKHSQNVSYGGCPAFLDEEVDYWLDKGYYDTVITKFSGNNQTKIGFEGSVKRISDLEGLIKTDENINVTLQPDTNKVVLNDLLNSNLNNKGRMFFVQAILKWQMNGVTKQAIVNLVSHEASKQFIQTYNNTPWIENPVGVIRDNKLIIYVDPISMKGFFTLDITYVKHPKSISQMSENENLDEIPEQLQNDLINRAVQLALEDIESQRLSNKSQLNAMVD